MQNMQNNRQNITMCWMISICTICTPHFQPGLKAWWKCCVEFQTTPSLRTGLILQSFGLLKASKTKIFKRSNLVFSFFWGGGANALWSKTGGGNICILVSNLECMDFSSAKGLLYIGSENQLVSALLRCRTEGKQHCTQNQMICESRNPVRISEKSWTVICMKTAWKKINTIVSSRTIL